MLVSETVYSLEMNSPDELRPGRHAPQPVEWMAKDADDWELLSSTFIRIGDNVGQGFQTRRIPPWSEAQWRERLNTPGAKSFVAYVEDEVAGYLDLQWAPNKDVEIVVFGLVPEFIGRGFGGEALTEAIRLAWKAGDPVLRVWLHTSTRDHANALNNYQSRGFSVFHTEDKEREIQLRWIDNAT